MAKTQADAYVNHVCADFRHATAGSDTMSKAWLKVAETSTKSPGARAYAYQQADMYAHMRDNLDRLYRTNCKGDPTRLDHSMVSYDHIATKDPTERACVHIQSLRGALQQKVSNIAAYEPVMDCLRMA